MTILTTSIIVFTLAVVAWFYRDTLLVGLIGPPKATLSEAYEENPDGPNFDHSAFSVSAHQNRC